MCVYSLLCIITNRLFLPFPSFTFGINFCFSTLVCFSTFSLFIVFITISFGSNTRWSCSYFVQQTHSHIIVLSFAQYLSRENYSFKTIRSTLVGCHFTFGPQAVTTHIFNHTDTQTYIQRVDCDADSLLNREKKRDFRENHTQHQWFFVFEK